MHAWLITVGEPLPLPGTRGRIMRTGLLADELVRRGHRVTWWTSRVDHYAKTYFPVPAGRLRIGDRLDLVFLDGVLYRRNVSFARLVNHAQVARAFAKSAAREARPDVVLCSWPTIALSRAALRYCRRARVPLLIDVRDLWPDAFFDLLPRPANLVARALARPVFGSAGRILAGATGIVATSPAYLAWALALARRPQKHEDLVAPLGYPRRALARDASARAEAKLAARGVDAGRPLAWFVGSFGRTYDLEPLIDAARLLSAGGRHDLQFVVSGAGERGAAWRRRADGLENVVFTGWLDADEVAWMLGRAYVGIAAYAARAPQGLPNKVLEYLSAGLPVLSSLTGETQRLLEEAGCGITYGAGDAGSLVSALRRLLDEPGLRRSMSERALATFDASFASEVVTTRLARHLEDVAAVT